MNEPTERALQVLSAMGASGYQNARRAGRAIPGGRDDRVLAAATRDYQGAGGRTELMQAAHTNNIDRLNFLLDRRSF
jgi:hypothetical protein